MPCATWCAPDAAETLAASDAVPVIGETGFPRQGNASCGVKRQ